MNGKSNYLIRLDDACPTMDVTKWGRMEALLDKYGVKPMIGIVPSCRDENLKCQEPDPAFWEKARNWQSKGYAIALHGYDHVYISEDGLKGLNPMWKRSEFAGVPLEEQRKKVREGIKVLEDNGLTCEYFFAPSHTFDENTLKALQKESEIRIISDTIALEPYLYKDFLFIPQIVGAARKMPFSGVFTFCYHPNVMKNSDFDRLESFLKRYNNSFISFHEFANKNSHSKKLFDVCLSKLFFLYRKLRNLR